MSTNQQPVAVYDYRDERGSLLYQVCRYHPKRFLQRRPSETKANQWVWNLEGTRKVLYRLPELLARPTDIVYLVEGEKDADTLIQRGFLATTVAGGANSPWQDSFTEVLKNRMVILIPDNDQPGHQFMKTVGDLLWLNTKECRWCELPNLPAKGDVSDWFASGGTMSDFEILVGKAPNFATWMNQQDRPEPLPTSSQESTARGFTATDVINLGAVQAQSIRWLWKPWLPEGKLCLIDGDPGQGKSFVTLDVAARLSRGDSFPDLQPNPFGPQNTLLICCEDGLADTVVPRLRDIGADMNRVFGYQGHLVDGLPMRIPKLPDDVPLIRKVIEHTHAKLVVIDPLMAFLGESVNTVSDASIRQVLTPLAVLADQMRVTFLFVRHLNKTNGKNAIYRGGGSIGITAAMRSAMMIGRHPHDRDKRILAMVKNNLAEEPKSLEFHLETGDAAGTTVVWDGNTDLLANDLVGDAKGNAISPKDWLHEMLREPKLAEDVITLGKEAGYCHRILQKAKIELGIISKKRRNQWFWLPVGQSDFKVLEDLSF